MPTSASPVTHKYYCPHKPFVVADAHIRQLRHAQYIKRDDVGIVPYNIPVRFADTLMPAGQFMTVRSIHARRAIHAAYAAIHF